MSLWASVSRRFRSRPRGSEAIVGLTEAYRDVFEPQRSASDAQKQIVLADMANFSGFYKVAGPEFTGDQRAYQDGMRLVFGRVFRFLRMSEAEICLLQEAARTEAIMDAQDSEI